MSTLSLYILSVIFRKALRHGRYHAHNLLLIHVLLRETLQDEFTEDSPMGLSDFSRKFYELAWKDKR